MIYSPPLRESPWGEAPILDESALSNLLGLLYDAASDQTLWTPFLESVAEKTGGHAAAIVMNSSDDDLHMLALSAGMSPEVPALYKQHYFAHDLWLVRALADLRSVRVGTSDELCSWDEFRKTEFYNDFALPVANVGHGMFAFISRDRNSLTNLTVYRTPKQGPFEDKDLVVLKLLSPHLRRAFRLHFQLTSLQDRSRSFDTVLDSLPQGIILIGAGGAIIHMNRTARTLLSASGGLLASTSGLSAERPFESQDLQLLITRAISTSLGKGLNAGGGIRISRKCGEPLNVVVSPVRGLATDFSQKVCAIVYVTDPTVRVRPRNELLQEMFGLTPAECRIALLVVDGVGTAEIRELTRITANTLKTHLASIYRKTRTSRQTQLVKLILLMGMASTKAEV